MELSVAGERAARPRRARLICLTGIDGSGKTTLASSLAEHLRERGYRNVRYVHGILIRQILLKAVKPAAQRLFMRGTDERANYVHYQEVKVSASQRHRVLSALYGAVWFLDYVQEAFRRVTLPVLGGQLVVADRYVFDLLLNISLATARPVTSFSWLLKLFFLFNPRPDIVFLVDTPEEIAFARKADVHAIEYLRERRSEYLVMAERYGFQVLDGRAARDELLNEVLARSFPAARQAAGPPFERASE